MSFRNASLLSMVFLLLSAWVFFVELRKPDPGPSSPTRPLIVGVDFDEIIDIEVYYQGNDIAVSRNEDGSWRFRNAGREDGLAQTERVTAIRVLLAGLTADRLVVQQSDDLAEYGLEEPEIQVAVGAKNGTMTSIRVGSRTPNQLWQYWKTADSESVYLVVFEAGEQLARFVTEPPIPPPIAIP